MTIKHKLEQLLITDDTVVDVMCAVPRDQFVAEDLKALTYSDVSLPIGQGRKMLLPAQEASILQQMHFKVTDKVLVLGTGNGYLTALIAKQCLQVYSVDTIDELTQQAKERCATFGIDNVGFETGDYIEVAKKHLPYDAIVCTVSDGLSEEVLLELAEGDIRLFVIESRHGLSYGKLVTKSGSVIKQLDLFQIDA